MSFAISTTSTRAAANARMSAARVNSACTKMMFSAPTPSLSKYAG